MAASEPIRSKKQVKKMAEYYLVRGQLRNYALVILGVYTALRISDLLCVQWEDIYDFGSCKFRCHFNVVEKKTGKIKTIALNKQAIDALNMYFSILPSEKQTGFIFKSNRRNLSAISRVQAWRLIRHAADAVGIFGHISCHSLRKTFGYHAWKSGVPIAVIMDIYNHSSFAVTRRYLGVCQDDRDKVYLNISFA